MWYRMSAKKKVSLVMLFDGDKVLLGEKDYWIWNCLVVILIMMNEIDCAKREFKERLVY